MERRRCAACGGAFRPRSQVPDQKYCSASACQRARRRRWQRAKVLREQPPCGATAAAGGAGCKDGRVKGWFRAYRPGLIGWCRRVPQSLQSALQGIYDYNPLRPRAMAGLEQLRTTQGGALPPRLKSEIKRELQRLELVVEMIATLEAERNAIVEDEASTHINAKKIHNLHKLKAIGLEFAAVLVGEIFHRDFKNRRQLASYVGFAPSPFQSGNVAHDQGISKAGNRKGRTTGIELAWLWLSLSTRQRFERLVPDACRDHERPHPPHRHRGVGAQAAGGALALS